MKNNTTSDLNLDDTPEHSPVVSRQDLLEFIIKDDTRNYDQDVWDPIKLEKKLQRHWDSKTTMELLEEFIYRTMRKKLPLSIAF